MNEYPVPTLELTVSYHGKQNVADIPVVAKAWHNQSRVGIPDAVWTLGGEGDVRLYENGNSNIVTGVKYFGMNPMREMLIHLSPGSVVPGSIKFEFKDLAWILFNIQTLQSYVSDPVTAIWEGPIIDQPRNDDLSTGDIVRQGYPDESFGQYVFTPRDIPGMATNPKHEGKPCYGLDLTGEPLYAEAPSLLMILFNLRLRCSSFQAA